MSTPQATIESDLKTAMKARDRERTGVLRMLLTAVKNERIRAGEDPDEQAFYGIVRKLIKQRREASEMYVQGGREELAAKETREAELLDGYLPASLSEDEIRATVEATVGELGLTGPSDMGTLMKTLMARFAGAADNATVSRLARDALAKLASG